MNQQDAYNRQLVLDTVAVFLFKMSPATAWQESVKITHEELSQELLKQFEQSQRRFKYHPPASPDKDN